MSNYAKVNLLDLEDTVGDRAPEITGRFGRTALGSRDIGVSHFRYAPGAGPDGLDVIAVGGPKPEGGDGELASADWPD
jgi:hypothetical protein